MNKNGYFQIEKKNDGLYLNIIPPMGEGKPASLDELSAYLDKKKISFPNIVELRHAFDTAVHTGQPVRFSESEVIPFGGWIEYQVVKDGSELRARMYPPMAGMPDVTSGEIMTDLSHMMVKFGIKADTITRITEEKRYLETVILAEGTQPVNGRDAEIKYYFSTEHATKPKLNEDGTVDFHQLDMISCVKEGDVVAEIIPEDKGTAGMNIYGTTIMPRKVARKVFRYGRNLQVSEDGRKLITLVTGHITLEGEKVFVSTDYEVPADVNTGTGDINFDGNVKVYGNVLAGFSVKASGNVIVNGVVESATIIAGGDIILQRGILGANKGILEAGGNITANFIESATVKAGGDIDVNSILHSNVNARGIIEVHGKKGSVTGGVVRAGSRITSKIIGSEMGTNTIVSVGTDPEMLSCMNELKNKILSTRQDKDKVMQIIVRLKKKLEMDGKLSKEQLELLQTSIKTANKLDEEQEEARNEYRKMSGMVCEDSDARIQVVGSIYPGCKIEIGEVSLFIREKNDHCQYVKRGVDITREVL
ncbi:MAG: DUF342 domain-containing protein [Butyrivibrio sp.]